LKPDDEALIRLFYYLGYTHGMRYSLKKLNHEDIVDRDEEKSWIELLPPEVSALRFGADPIPAAEKIETLISTWKKNRK
jgi:hypothetical protein